MKRIAFFLFVMIPMFTSAQKYSGHINVIAGSAKNMRALAGQTTYNLVFNYDSMLVGAIGEPEVVYLTGKKASYETKAPGSGGGQKFEKAWFGARKDMYELTFSRNFPTFAKVKVGDPAAKYTLILKTVRTDGGWNVGVLQKVAVLDLQLWVVETADNSKVLTKIEFLQVRGTKTHGGDSEMPERIQDAYLYASKVIGDYFAAKTQ